VAYATPPVGLEWDEGVGDENHLGSLVLLGDSGVDEHSNPNIVKEIQDKGVIKVTFGDYHYGAITSSGNLYVWGTDNSSCLGLGDPLSPSYPGNEPSPPPSDEEDEEEGVDRSNAAFVPRTRPAPTSDIRTPNLETMPRILPANQRGITPNPLNPQTRPRRRPHRVRPFGPANVQTPTLVSFSESGRRKFVFNVAFAGWHSSALVIDLDEDVPTAHLRYVDDEVDSDSEEEEMEVDDSTPNVHPHETANNHPLVAGIRGRGMHPFRIGLWGGRGRMGARGV